MTNVKFLKGIKSALPTNGVDNSSLYFVEDSGELFKSVGNGQPLVKIGDVLGNYTDLTDLQTKNPAIQGKLYLTNDSKLYTYNGTSYELISGSETISADNVTETATHKVMTADERIKLAGIEENANNYVHPTTHAPSEIATDSSNRFVTDAQIANWDDKYTKTEVDNKVSAVVTGLDWKESVATFADLATTYTTAEEGWTASVKDDDIIYRYDGTTWVAISANSIPLVTQSVDGKMSKEDKTKLDGITANATKVEASTTNGNIKINGTETTVFSLEWESFGI